ncbi:hypothetical protein WELLINGTON_172 [Erwinia phage Wellington]|uniref:Lipoprotein n=2 Tax=Wellingtonvirus wellington TaxID=2734153 RepID=A0A1B2IE90_9CAUD|nr:hypothetical protein BIZ80_gp126 [Erwinia phage vB_EamM_Kwan]YP_009806656.1 hypothetical protein HOT70_gp129 [Erwinia phage Wellington]ANZ49525.1 hypothetical protein KWAN_173 [Erwinia phage vB_EamM_Kwan]AXF51301.1 hypothetical protein WELLINGTON_172 [Erwinia phage Wellington]
MLRFIAAFFVAMLLGGCALTTTNGQFSTAPVAPTDFVTYTCTGAQETFVNWRPDVAQVKLYPVAVTVIDNGSNWVATFPGGKVESPQLYKDLLGKVDGSVDLLQGTRYYRLNTTPPTYSYSTVDMSGNGSGATFFRCQVGTGDAATAAATPASSLTPSDAAQAPASAPAAVVAPVANK